MLHLQAANAVLCPGEVAFPGHVRHVETDVAPTVAEYVPAEQLVHTPDPGEFLYCPAKHGVHVCPLVPGYPTLHVQFVMLMLALGELEFVGQRSQLPAPITLFHFPASHAVQGPPAGPE